MTNTNCSGGQDRNTTTSETHPTRPPPKTEGCYLTDGFDRSRCGTADDGACPTHGRGPSCIPDDYGGYCKEADKFYISHGTAFRELKGNDLLDRYKSDTSDSDIRVRRALNDQERRMTNKIRQLQIMGQDSGPRSRERNNNEDNEVHDFVGQMLFNVGMTSIILIFLISISVILIQNKFI